MAQYNEHKIYVLDTNVALFDWRCLLHFQEHNVVIPITVLEELDTFKKGNDTINYHAREFTRELDTLMGEKNVREGIPLPDGGVLVVETDIRMDEEIRETFREDNADHRILALTANLAAKHGKERVILVSKDINLRVKARSIGILAEDYRTGKVKDLSGLYRGKNLIENYSGALIDRLYQDGAIPLAESEIKEEPVPNEYFILKNHKKSTLVRYTKKYSALMPVGKQRAYGIKPRNAEQTFALDALMDQTISLVTLSGKAGTGKTLLALAAAIEERKIYRKILLARPIIPLSNRDMGFLPGDIDSKLNPYMQPLFDNLSVIQDQFAEGSSDFKRLQDLIKEDKLEIVPLAYIRGRSLSRVFFIVDEAQNLTPHEVKTIITRAGEGSKIVFTGDPHQIDTPYLDARSNGLTTLIDRMKGQEIYAHVTLEKGERSSLAELASDLL